MWKACLRPFYELGEKIKTTLFFRRKEAIWSLKFEEMNVCCEINRSFSRDILWY